MAIVLCVCFLLSGGKFDPIEQQCVFFSLPPVFVGKAVSSKIEKIQKTKRNCFSKTSKGSCAVVCVSFFFLFRVCKCVCVSACLTHPSSRLPSKGKSIRNQLKTQQMNFFFFSIEKVFWKKIFLEEKRTQPSPPPLQPLDPRSETQMHRSPPDAGVVQPISFFLSFSTSLNSLLANN